MERSQRMCVDTDPGLWQDVGGGKNKKLRRTRLYKTRGRFGLDPDSSFSGLSVNSPSDLTLGKRIQAEAFKDGVNVRATWAGSPSRTPLMSEILKLQRRK